MGAFYDCIIVEFWWVNICMYMTGAGQLEFLWYMQTNLGENL